MCRHAAYLGPAVPINLLTHGSGHDLEHQAYQARELLTGVVCADGFGVAWYEGSIRPEPARYASPLPIWGDTNLRSFGGVVQSECIMAAVRNATEAGSTQESNCAPFVSGRFSFSLNGFVDGFDAHWATWMADLIAPERRSLVRGNTDAEHMFHAILSRHEAGEDLPTATQGLLRDVANRARELGQSVQLNILLCDGERLIATRAGTAARSNSLYLLRDGDDMPGSVVVASEPLMDDPEWQSVDDQSLLVLQAEAPPVRLSV